MSTDSKSNSKTHDMRSTRHSTNSREGDRLDPTFIEKTLRRFIAGKKLPAAQLEELEKGGFICPIPNGEYQLTFAGADLLKKGT